MVRVHMVAGFLGAGKTTFIKRLLSLGAGQRVVVLENEFGDVNIDGDRVRQDGYEVVEVTSGCICCSLKGTFTDALHDIIHRLHPDIIIVEPSGLALLSGLLEIFNNPALKESCAMGQVITIIDGVNYLEQADVFGEFFKDQICNARMLCISKTKQLESADLLSILQSLRSLNAKAPLLYEDWEALTDEQLRKVLFGGDLAAGDLADIYMNAHEGAHQELHDFSSLTLPLRGLCSPRKMKDLLALLGDPALGHIYRAKGSASSSRGALEFNYVQGSVLITESAIHPMNQICLIGRNLQARAIETLFENTR